MQNTKEIYEDLTTVNIDQQKDVWDERGKGYYGEYLVFSSLFHLLKDDSKILMNVELPTENGKTTEIDILLIHETGLYCFETKYYKGDIFCNFDNDVWVQAFRTVKNNAFYSPVYQNEYHIAALKNLYPHLPIYSFIIFTNDDVTLHEGKRNTFVCREIEDGVVCDLNWFNQNISSFLKNKEIYNSSEQINNIFTYLTKYTRNKQSIRIDGDRTLTFEEYINSFHKSYNNKIAEIEKETNKRIKSSNTARNIAISLAMIGIIIGILGTTILPNKRIKMVEDKYADFFKKFEEVNRETVINNITADQIVKSENITINNVNNDENTISISFDVAGTSNDYGVSLTQDSRLIVQLNDGNIKEVDIFSDEVSTDMILRANAMFMQAENGKSFHIKTVNIPNVKKEDINYMKLINTSLYRIGEIGNIVDSKFEFEIYK